MEGAFAAILKAEDVVRDEVPTCTLTDRVGEVYQRCQAAGWKVCIVVNDRNVVLGRLRGEAWKVEPGTRVEEIMENGPTTFRPDFFLEPLVKRMHDRKVGSVIVTNSDGVLIGVVYRADAENAMASRSAEERGARTDLGPNQDSS